MLPVMLVDVEGLKDDTLCRTEVAVEPGRLSSSIHDAAISSSSYDQGTAFKYSKHDFIPSTNVIAEETYKRQDIETIKKAK